MYISLMLIYSSLGPFHTTILVETETETEGRRYTSAHVECSKRNEIFTLPCCRSLTASPLTSQSLSTLTSLPTATFAHVRTALPRSLSFVLTLALFCSLSCLACSAWSSFLFRIRKIITKLIINCKAMQFERIMRDALSLPHSPTPTPAPVPTLHSALLTLAATLATC